MKKLSKVQQSVINALKSNPDYFIRSHKFYNHQEVISPTPIPSKYDESIKSHIVMGFSKPTLEVLDRLGYIVQITDNKYVLNPTQPA